MPYSGTNAWGPYVTPSGPTGTEGNPVREQNPSYAPTATPSAAPAVPQSPSGSVTGRAAAWNNNAGETSTQYYLDTVLNVDAPQAGVAAISNVKQITASFAGVDPATVAVNNYTAGSVGSVGTKFS